MPKDLVLTNTHPSDNVNDGNMAKGNSKVYTYASRIIKVEHPYLKDLKGKPVVLFEAQVKIVNLNLKLVKAITKVNIDYDLRESD